jgi:hypothetical protein
VLGTGAPVVPGWRQGFSADLPRTLGYVRDAAARYDELRRFSQWIERRLVPGLAPANARVLASGAVSA